MSFFISDALAEGIIVKQQEPGIAGLLIPAVVLVLICFLVRPHNKRSKQGGFFIATICIVASIVGLIWAQSHAPGDLGAALTRGWVLNEGPYYAILAFDLLFGIYGGIGNLIIAFQKNKTETN